MEDLYYDYFESPMGRLWVAATSKGLCRVNFASSEEEFLTSLKEDTHGEPKRGKGPFKDLFERLEKYFKGEPTSFSDLPLDLRGTDFQRMVWRAVTEIPYGKTSTYGEVAAKVGHPRAGRAAGSALKMNQLLIVVPCHRVVRSDGRLGGFSGGAEGRRRLLRLEGVRGY
jgi:O-6-methylguanine DNA methyltransferase